MITLFADNYDDLVYIFLNFYSTWMFFPQLYWLFTHHEPKRKGKHANVLSRVLKGRNLDLKFAWFVWKSAGV